MASLRPLPVMVLTPVLGEAATTSWPPWRRMGAVFEPIRPVPPMMTTFIPNLLVLAPERPIAAREGLQDALLMPPSNGHGIELPAARCRQLQGLVERGPRDAQSPHG